MVRWNRWRERDTQRGARRIPSRPKGRIRRTGLAAGRAGVNWTEPREETPSSKDLFELSGLQRRTLGGIRIDRRKVIAPIIGVGFGVSHDFQRLTESVFVL